MMMLGLSLSFVLLISSTPDLFQEASAVLADLEGIRLEENESGELSLRGTVYRREDLEIIDDFLSKHPEVQRAFSLDRELRTKRSSAKPPTARRVYFLELVLMEVQKTAFQKLGLRLDQMISLSGEAAFGFVKGDRFLQATGTTDPIRAFLDLALQNGEARVHAKQSLITEEGKAGTFFAGGELPLKVVSRNFASIEFKEFGMRLQFIPTALASGRIHLQLQSEISDIDTGAQVDGIPVIMKKTLHTQFTSTANQMVAIGGLVRSNQSRFSDKTPGLSAIPIFGRLFQSKDFKNHKSEAYLFVTPKLMDKPWMPSPEF